ncbi:uncharacterized protein PRCAT00001821001 [Priceomyces carsonii]|uniref:uncharacterized protein n=1 Tax=Priceomyces carsonii TaxID=28549 RepID=UPI002EDB91C4|nr:unnamed protein product [Priceomyces carsonii]
MEEQITQAVEIALSGTADLSLKSQAYHFIDQIKSSEEGFKTCMDILVKSSIDSNIMNESLKFFIYQVIDENIERLNEEQLFNLNSSLFKVLSDFKSKNISDPAYLKNKLATLLARTFCSVYISIYPNYFKDLFNLISDNNQLALDYYARILIAIHSEVGDKFIPRSKEAQEKQNVLKDQIRSCDMEALVDSWSKILMNPANSPEILNGTLKIVGQYITWMDISLFVSNQFIGLIFQYLNRKEQRNETCLTLAEIISKKMKPINKLELITMLDLATVIESSVDFNDPDLEFLENVSILINQIGTELLIILENEPELLGEVNQQLFKVWQLVFTCLSHEYDDVSQQAFPFIQNYLLFCKKYEALNSLELLSSLLNKIILKIKYDDDDDGLDDDIDEQFSGIRSKLKTFQDTIAILKPNLYLEAIPIVINESIFKFDEDNSSNVDWRKIELGLYELNNFSESLRNNLINLPKGEINRSKPYFLLQNFITKLINSNFILNVKHPKVQLSFFEIIVKHFNFLNISDPQIIVRILEVFTSPLGLFNELERVRSRSWYLFFRFVRLSRPVLNDETMIESLLLKFQPLLIIKAELPVRDEDNDLVENGNFNGQLYLFESIGLLISLLSIDISNKLKLVDLIFQPLFSDLESCIENLGANNNQLLIALQAHHTLMAIGTFARGYDHDLGNKYSSEIVEKINNAAQVVLITLDNFSKFESIREAARFSYSRFIPILKNQINNHLSKLVSLILAANNLKINELSDFLGFLGQIVHQFRSDENIYQLLNSLLSPLVQKIFEMLNKHSEDEQLIPDLVRDKYSLKKSFMAFISVIIFNHSSSLLVTETNKKIFPEIIKSLFEYAYDLSETSVSKLAISQLINIVNVFGNGGKIQDPEDKFSENLPAVEGIDAFLMERVIQLSFELPFQRAEFDLKDAQYRLIGQEISLLLKTYQQKKGDEYLNYLSNYLTTMGLSQSLMSEFGTNLVELDQKAFKKYFINFVTKLKGK